MKNPIPKETKSPKLFFNINFISKVILFYNRFIIQMSQNIIKYIT